MNITAIHKKTYIINIMLCFIFIIFSPAVFAKYTGYVDYDEIYNPKHYESRFNENTVIAVMQPGAWSGNIESYYDNNVFDDVDIDYFDIIYRCDDPSDDKMGDVLLLHLRDGSREKVIETINALKDNEYVIYSFPDFKDDDDDDDIDDDIDADNLMSLTGDYEYHLDNGIFSLKLLKNGSQMIALYKENRLVSFSIGTKIDITDKDFDTLKVILWRDLSSLHPVQDTLNLTYDQVMAADAPEPQYGDIPCVYLEGDMTDMSKDTRVKLKMTYESTTEKKEGYVSAKWQGNAATQFPKKNFAIKVYKDEALENKLKIKFKDWDKSNNYVLKANYIDATQARNIVCARLYQKFPGTYFENGSQGVIDGFPIRLYINGEFHGLYTWNKPKKGWVFRMSGDNPSELLYFSNYSVGSGLFKNKYSRDKFWEIVYPDEYEGTEEFDRVTDFVATCSDEDFKNHIEEYIDLNSMLNYYVFAQVILHHDGVGKNMNMATYDGNLWYMCPYDLDATFGLEWYGSKLKEYDMDMSEKLMRNSVLWRKLEDTFPQEIYDRYILLRNNQLSKESILSEFRYFMDEVGSDLYAENLAKWPNTPGKQFMLNQIEDYLNKRYEYLDPYMEKFNTSSQQ